MLQPFFEWMGGLAFSSFFLQNTWASPIIQCIHLLSLVVFSGAILVVDVRLLGKGLVNTPLAQLARIIEPFLIWSFVALVATGVPMMMSLALKEYYSPHFWWKMQVLLLGLVFTFTIRRKVALADEAEMGSVLPKIVGLLSMTIWTTVAVWARLIGLLS